MMEPDQAEIEIDPSVAPDPARPGASPSVGGGPKLPPAQAQELIASLEREAKALGQEPAAARLHYEMGLLWNEPLENPPKAAVCFQNAYRIAPRHVANLRAARRLFTGVGNWQMVAQLLEAEAVAVEDEGQKRALLVQRAQVLDQRLGLADEALAVLEQCQRAAPRDPAVLLPLEAAYRARGDARGLRATLAALADAVADGALKAYYLAAAARLDEGPLGAPADAAPLVRRALALAPENPEIITAAKRAAERESDSDALCRALEAEARATPGPAAAPIFHRISRILERTGRHEEALQALLDGRRAAPSDPLILDELARVFEAAGRFGELADVLKSRCEGLQDAAELIAVELQLGGVYEEKLGREDEAIACYRRVLAVAPAHPTAIGALGKLYYRRQNWQGLIETYEAEIRGCEDPRLKSARLYKAAELLERLGSDAEAIARYNEALELRPGYLPATKALIRMYERLERWEDLVALYEQDLGQTDDRDQTIALLARIAAIQEERLKDLTRAAATLRRIVEIAPDHLSTIRDLARLCERAGLWEELIRVHELEAALAGDSKQVISLLHSNAEICEERLKDRDRAVDAYRKVLNLSASYLPALQALGRLYAQAGQWADLVSMYRQEAEITPSPEQAAGLIFKAGGLLEEKLGRPDEAIAAYQEVLTLSPSFFPALRSLARIYRAQFNFERLVEVLRAEAASRVDRKRRANLLFQVASIWEDDLGRPDVALETYRDALANDPDHGPSIRALERLYARQGAFAESAALLERELSAASTGPEKLPILQKLAYLYADRLGDPVRAEQAFAAVVALRPKDVGALKSLEVLRAASPGLRAEVRARIAEALSDPAAAAAHLYASSLDREREGSPALAELRRVLELCPDDACAVDGYENALRRAGDFEALASFLAQRAARAADPELRLALQMRLGEICEWKLGALDRAFAAYRAVLDAEPRHLPAIRAARRVLDPQRSPREVQKLLVAEAEATIDAKAASELYLEAGGLAEGPLNDVEAARAAYQAALVRDAFEPRATARLEELLARAGGSEEIAALHLSRSRTRAREGDAAGAASEGVRAARVLAEGLRDTLRALAALDEVLAQVPDHAEALELRGELCLSMEDWPGAAQAFGRRVEEDGDPARLAALHHKLGVLYHDRLGDPGRASAHLMTALAADPSDFEALERIGAIHLAERNWSGAADAFKRLIESNPEPERLARYVCTYARIAEDGFGELQTAAGGYRRALELLPGDAAIIERLASLCERLGNIPELTSLVEAQAAQAAAAGDKARAAALRVKVAELCLRQGEVQRAIQAYRLAAELAPADVALCAALADLLTRDGSSLPAAIEQHRALLRLDPCRLESYHALYGLFLDSRQVDRAVCAGHVLASFRALTESEAASFEVAKAQAPSEPSEILPAEDLDGALLHPLARSPLTELMRTVGDQLHKLYEPGPEAKGLGRGDRLKPDHPLHRAARALCTSLGVEKLEIYQGKRGASVQVENTDPLSLIVGPDFARRNSAREQRFLLGRACLHLRNKMPLALRLDPQVLAELLGGAIRIAVPEFALLGKPDPELTRRLRKAMSGRAVRALEALAPELSGQRTLHLTAWLRGALASADRAGALLCGDAGIALQVLLRDEARAPLKLDSPAAVADAVRGRREIAELLDFAVSDEYFRLRSKLRLAVG
jgi:tetratricopeptide (TPR) repeat protein